MKKAENKKRVAPSYSYNAYMLDFETSTEKWYNIKGYTEIWAWACTNCRINSDEPLDMTDSADVAIGRDFGSLLVYLDTQLHDGDKAYWHNLKFDGAFIASELLNRGWLDMSQKEYESDSYRLKKARTFTLLADGSSWYSITLCFGNKVIEIRDSLKRIPMTVRQMAKEYKLPILKGEIDYDRDPSLPITEKEKKYIRHDVLIPAEITRQQYREGFHQMTLASYAYKSYTSWLNKALKDEKSGKEKIEKRLFPVLDPEEENVAREAYDGGEVYVNPIYAGRLLGSPLSNKKTCFTWDINSMYPAVMSACPMPIGRPEIVDSIVVDEKDPSEYRAFRGVTKRYFVRVRKMTAKLKEGRIPSVGIPVGFGKRHFAPYFTTESKCYADVRWEMILDDYDIEELEIDCYHVYNARTDLFYDYIQSIVREKNIASASGNRMRKALAKVKMNSLYGKFGQRGSNVSLGCELDEDGEVEYTHFVTVMDSKYVPVAAIITAEARLLLVSQCNKFTSDCVAYTDTDSIHVLQDVENVHHDIVPYRRRPIPETAEEKAAQIADVLSQEDLYNMIREFEYGRPKEIWCDEYDLGAFKIEGQFACAKYLRAKTYIEGTHATEDDYKAWKQSIEDETWDGETYVIPGNYFGVDYKIAAVIKGAGIPNQAKLNITVDNFEIGLVINGRLIPKRVKGGCVLVESQYEIKDDKTVLVCTKGA